MLLQNGPHSKQEAPRAPRGASRRKLENARAHGRIAVVCSLAILIVSGCGSADPKASEKPNKPDASQEEPAVNAQTKTVLPSRFAGSWYSDDPKQLKAQLDTFLKNADLEPAKNIIAVIMPHAGYGYSGQTAAFAAKAASGKAYRRVVVIGPTHRVPMENIASVPAVTHYGTPLGEVPLDLSFIEALKKHPEFKTLPRVHEGEHSVQMEIPILQHALGSFRLVPIVVGLLNPETARKMAGILRGLVDAETLVVISSDFTHYGPNFDYLPFEKEVEANLKKLDLNAFAAIEKSVDAFSRYLQETQATICGRECIKLAMEMLPKDAKPRLLKYDTSGRMTNDFSNSVSYLSIAFTGAWSQGEALSPPSALGDGFTDPEKKSLLALARKTIAYFLEKGELPNAKKLSIEVTPAMSRTMGVFVTLKKEGQLRGCIGQIFGTGPLYKAVIEQAKNAATRDPRFPRLEAAELAKVQIEISALTEPKEVGSYKEIVIGKHGMVLEKHGRSAVFLPQVAPEQGWDIDTTLTHLSRKAGLPADAWKEGASYQVFEAHVFHEADE